MKEQIITLRIVYNPENYDAPMNWSWSGILDLGADEEVELMDYSEIKETENQS